MPRYFTHDEAQKLLPVVEPQVRQMIHLSGEQEKVEEQLEAIATRVTLMGGVILDRDQLLKVRARRDALVLRLKETIEAILDLGCQIKDHRAGLIDFPTLFRGEEVYLCWKFGEESISFWHGDEGFRGRKQIDREFLAGHRGESVD